MYVANTLDLTSVEAIPNHISRELSQLTLCAVIQSPSNLWGPSEHSSARNRSTMKTSDVSYWNLH